MPSSNYTFNRDGDTTNPITINFSVGGTAIFNTDYTVSGADSFTATSGSVTIPSGQSSAVVVVTTVPDFTPEPNETVILTPVSNSFVYNLASTNGVTVTIQNDDGIPLTYVSPGDTNGLFYRIGTNAGTESFVNPATNGRIALLNNPVEPTSPETITAITNRATSNHYSSNTANAWIAVDIGAGRNFSLAGYLLQARNSGNEHLRSWRMEATNTVSAWNATGVNSASWTILDTRNNDTTLNTNNAWGYFALAAQAAQFRYYRLIQTGLNSSGSNFLTLGEIELYGTLF